MTVKQIATVLVFAAVAVVAHPLTTKRADISLSDWNSHNLESYWTFRNRYHSLNCASQRGTGFYESCCYPLGSSETLSSRPENCTPSVAAVCDVVPAAVIESDNEDSQSEDENQDEDEDEDQEVDQGEDDQEDESLPWCEDGDYDGGDDENNQDQNNDQNQNQDDNQDARHTRTTSYYPPEPTEDPGDDHAVITGGRATWYEQEGLAGACGQFHSDDEMVAAMDYRRYGDIDSVSPLCGKRVHVKNTRNGNSVVVVIRDVCPTCANENSIDLSLAAFRALDNMDVGVLPIEWYYL